MTGRNDRPAGGTGEEQAMSVTDRVVEQSDRTGEADRGDPPPAPQHLLARAVAITGLAVTAWVHAPVAVEHWSHVPYLGVAFAVLVVVAAAIAGSLLVDGSAQAWIAALVLTAGAVALYAVSRQIGLPGAEDDIGDWTDPAGVVAVGAELVVAVVAARVLLRRRAPH